MFLRQCHASEHRCWHKLREIPRRKGGKSVFIAFLFVFWQMNTSQNVHESILSRLVIHGNDPQCSGLASSQDFFGSEMAVGKTAMRNWCNGCSHFSTIDFSFGSERFPVKKILSFRTKWCRETSGGILVLPLVTTVKVRSSLKQ